MADNSRTKNQVLFLVFIILAFGSPIYIDLKSGNVSLIIYFFLWLGFLNYYRGRFLAFSFYISLASVFKLIPILFLALLWIDPNQDKRKSFFIGLSVTAGYLALNFVLLPGYSLDFLGNLFTNTLQENGGIHNPSFFHLISEISHGSKRFWDIINPQYLLVSAYSASIFVLILVSYKHIRLLKSTNEDVKDVWLIMISCLVYSLLMPRFKDYDYILSLLPVFYIFEKSRKIIGPWIIVFVLLISFNHYIIPPFFEIPINLIHIYINVIFTLIVWFGAIFHIRNLSSPPHV